MTNLTRNILIDTGSMGMIWVAANSGYTDFGKTYIPARRVAIYHVDGDIKSMNNMYEKLIL